MSLAAGDAFTVGAVPIAPIQSGTSVLLTGDDADVLESVFYQLVAPDANEHSVVLVTDDTAQAARTAIDGARTGAATRTTVLAQHGTGADGAVPVTDLGDLTRLGMELSSALATAQQQAPRFRSGVFLCSTVFDAADDLRSVYRLLNSNFLTELRRGDGIGVCAIDTSADFGTDATSVVAGMNTSFTAHVDVTGNGPQGATLTVSGLGDADGTVTMSP